MIALSYLRAGLCPLPAVVEEKRPLVKEWKSFQRAPPSERQVEQWFNNHEAICLVTGAVSGNLELLDFDCGGERFSWWRELVRLKAPELVDRLVLERSPSGGWHAIYRCQSPICGNIKLAERALTTPDDQEVELYGKKYKPRLVGDHYEVWLTMIETRGEGGLFLCYPSPGYDLVQGRIEEPPVLTDDEREILLEAAWSLNELKRPVVEPVFAGDPLLDDRPGDEFNERGDVRPVLRHHGWTEVKGGENEYWRRPGKTGGWSATLKDSVFFVFSQNAAPFEAEQGYSPFAVYTLLEHNGDYSAAASQLLQEGFGANTQPVMLPFAEPPCDPLPEDPGPIPQELLRVPGFVSEVMDLCLETAPYPNVAMAFAGALALQAFLSGRKVRDSGDNRTNIYLLGLVHSASGKDWIRKVNTKIAHAAGLSSAVGDRLASGEGIQDAMFVHSSMLFQTDEIDGLLQTINKAKDHRHENLMNTLLTMYSSSNSVFPMRPKAGNPNPGAIDQPNLVLFGTAIPNHYYAALSDRMLTNGFFARMLIVESMKRPNGQEPRIVELPERIVQTAHWWADYCPGPGNLLQVNPTPATVEATEEAQRLIVENRLQADAAYQEAEERDDVVGTTVWGRVNEQTRKLALLYAVSVSHRQPCIDKDAVRWASDIVLRQTRRMLYMANIHVSENEFDADCLKVIQKVSESPDSQIAHSKLLKRMKMDSKRFRELMSTLQERGEISTVRVATLGRTGTMYRLVSPLCQGKEGVKR